MKALFVDRDGIINEVVFRNGNIHSPVNWEELRFYPEIDKLPSLKQAGWKLVMVTNQPDLERKIVTQAFVDELHGDIKKRFSFDAIYCCPYASNEHPMKKPNPGMFLEAAKDLSLDLSKCFHLGDTERDVGAAKNAGCKSILWDRPYNQNAKADFRIRTFEELEGILCIPE